MKQTHKKTKFIGLKKYTHAQRTKIITKTIVPRIRKQLGKNLIAIAADGSYARNKDTDFSDIELIIFVKNKKDLPLGFGRIINGILIEGLYLTEQEYYKSTVEPNEYWYISGSDILKPIINPRFIKKVQRYMVKNLSIKCFKQATEVLYEIQESFGKLFNAIRKNNGENLFPVLADAVINVLKLMAFINESPYKTISSFITQAKQFQIKPKGFDNFIQIVVEGDYTDLQKLEQNATVLFAGIEDYFQKKMGENIYDSELSTIARKRW